MHCHGEISHDVSWCCDAVLSSYRDNEMTTRYHCAILHKHTTLVVSSRLVSCHTTQRCVHALCPRLVSCAAILPHLISSRWCDAVQSGLMSSHLVGLVWWCSVVLSPTTRHVAQRYCIPPHTGPPPMSGYRSVVWYGVVRCVVTCLGDAVW